MHRILHLILISLVLSSCLGFDSEPNKKRPLPQPVDPRSGKTLVWYEDFSGNSLNTNIWSYDIGTGSDRGLTGWGNNELQYYTSRSQNIRVENGLLKLTLLRENYGGSQYTSARIHTKGRKFFKYGFIEIRAKIPDGGNGKGVWPAIWMLSENNKYGRWPRSGEIDIMEAWGPRMDTVHATTHWWTSETAPGRSFNAGGVRTKTWPAKFSDEFHVYSLDWSEGALIYRVDNTIIANYSNTRSSSMDGARNVPHYPFDDYFHLILNIAYGGNPFSLAGRAELPWNNRFPQEMQIDYIKVWQ
jgi:beta-glucanase (GH16 family)